MTKPVFLVGMPGVGKTTIGRKLSASMELPFLDLDEFIEEQHGKSVKIIFAESGQDFFREMEAAALRQVGALNKGVVLATGGGTACFHDNMDFMNEAGTTVFLNAAPEIIADRLSHGKEQRPLIAGKSLEEIKKFVSETLQVRKQFYEKAQITYSGQNWDISDLCALIRKIETLC